MGSLKPILWKILKAQESIQVQLLSAPTLADYPCVALPRELWQYPCTMLALLHSSPQQPALPPHHQLPVWTAGVGIKGVHGDMLMHDAPVLS